MKKCCAYRIFTAILCILLAATALQLTPGAVVTSTTEPVGDKDTIYVAGNPDWYPVEYYDPDKKCYMGVLPQLLTRISEKTGIDFTYIQAGSKDQRIRLAQNRQIEIVSGISDRSAFEKLGLEFSPAALSVQTKDSSVQAYFAFTGIAKAELIEAFNAALEEISRDGNTGILLNLTVEDTRHPASKWLLAVCIVLAAFLVALSVAVLRLLQKYKSEKRQNENIDPGTGVGNKRYFVEQFEKTIPDQYRDLYCVAFIGFDINRVNQYYGEVAAEDQLLFAAKELIHSVADKDFVARVSGDGFAVVRVGGGKKAVGAWADELIKRLNKYTDKYGKDYHPDFRMGIYMLNASDRDSAQVLYNAQHGYQRAVSENIPYEFSQTDQLKREKEAIMLKKQTLDAIQNNEFKMYLQFQVRGNNGEIFGAEALSRWEHPKKGLLYPGSYIGLMESDGTIDALDYYILDEICSQLESWQLKGKDLSISCNFARITIDNASFVPHIQKIVEKYNFDHSRLIIEITEDSIESDKNLAFSNIFKCKDMGFRIALDDTGSGYTSFADLRDYPIDIVKIDRSVLLAAVNQRGISLLAGIISLVHSMHMEALCEGIETVEQETLLRRLGCDYMQGYYYYRALPTEEVNLILNTKDKH